jgi:nucleoside-diphosphate-sugar epimerase
MNILITGGSGFIGSHLAAYYVNQGHSVSIVDNLLTGNHKNIAGLPPDKMKFYEADICSFNFINLPQIDIAYHLASPASPIQYKKHPIETMLTNSFGTYRLFEFAKTGMCNRVVIASTSEVYGDPLEHPQKESYFGNVNSYGPRACYDEAKRFAEALAYSYISQFGLDLRIVRIFNTYGPNMEMDDGRIISNFVTQALSNKPITIYGDGKQTRSFCYVSDLVKGLVAMGEKENLRGQVINVGNPIEKSVQEMAELIKQMTQSSSEITYEKVDGDDPKKRKPDISKAQDVLGWTPSVTLEEGLTKTIEYFRNALTNSPSV